MEGGVRDCVLVCVVVFVKDWVGSFARVLVRERGYVRNCVTKIVWSNPLGLLLGS